MMNKTIGEIRFYSQKKAYGIYSNFYPTPITMKGKIWMTSEHYFQAQKFEGSPLEEEIRMVATPKLAAEIGRRRDKNNPLRFDWDTVRDTVMFDALEAKFTQHKDLKQQLLDTKDAKLIEDTANDSYWGNGGDGTGLNMLGVLLMKLRTKLQNETNDSK